MTDPFGYRGGGDLSPAGWPPQPPIESGKRGRKGVLYWVVVVPLAVWMVWAMVERAPMFFGPKPADVVQGYLEALARGDAAAALRNTGQQPPAEFLSDDILKAQFAATPITDIRVSSPSYARRSSATARVQASFTVGDQPSEVTFVLPGNKLPQAAVQLGLDFDSPVPSKSRETLTLFGRPVGHTNPFVFPGRIEIGSSNPYLAIAAERDTVPIDEVTPGHSASGAVLFPVKYALNEQGKSAVASAISAAVADCTASAEMAPPKCPQRIVGDGLVDGTAVWGQPDLDGMKTHFDAFHLTVTFGVTTKFPVAVQTSSGDTRSGAVDAQVGGQVDLSANPPTVAFD